MNTNASGSGQGAADAATETDDLLEVLKLIAERAGKVILANYTSDTASFTVLRDGREVTVLTPEKRIYDVQRRQTTEAAIHTTGLADLYAVIGDADGRGGWTVRIYHEPLVPWIWAGALLMVAGGAVSLSDRRLRVGAPRRRRKTAAAPA
jgi:cytochrome c-type biogenesis protein CcmF